MNQLLLNLFILCLIIVLSTLGLAQQNNDNKPSNQEYKDDSILRWNHSYDYLKRAKRNTRKMLKISVVRIIPDVVLKNTVPLNISLPEVIFEHKISDYISINVGEKFDFTSSENANTSKTEFSIRYWYRLKNLVENGVSANNLSSCYLSLSGIYYSISKNVEYKEQSSYSDLNNTYLFSPSIGYQQEIGKIGFLDINIGPAWGSKITGIQPLAYIKLGFVI